MDQVRRWYPGFGCVFLDQIQYLSLIWKLNKKWISRGDNIDRVSVSVVQKLVNMSKKQNVHLWLMPVLQRGSSIKVGDIDSISWFFLQAWPR